MFASRHVFIITDSTRENGRLSNSSGGEGRLAIIRVLITGEVITLINTIWDIRVDSSSSFDFKFVRYNIGLGRIFITY